MPAKSSGRRARKGCNARRLGGRLTSTTYGLNWSPIPQVRANISISDDSNAPDPGKLGDPVLVTPNRRVYDFVRKLDWGDAV